MKPARSASWVRVDSRAPKGIKVILAFWARLVPKESEGKRVPWDPKDCVVPKD